MRDPDKTKEQLTAELQKLRGTIEEFEERERRRHMMAEELSRIELNLDELEVTPKFGSWHWYVYLGRDAIVFKRHDLSDDELMWGEDQGFESWEQVVHPDDLDEVSKTLDLISKELPNFGATISFRTPRQTFMELGCDPTYHLPGEPGIELSGYYIERIPMDSLSKEILIPEADDWAVILRKWFFQKIDAKLNQDVERFLRKHTERIYEKREFRYDNIIENFYSSMAAFRGAVFEKNEQMEYTYVSPEVARMFGLSESEILGLTDEEVFDDHPDWRLDDTGGDSTGKYPYRTVTSKESGPSLILWTHGEDSRISAESELRCFGRVVVSGSEIDESQSESRSPAMREALKTALKAAETNSIVLLTGETGSGKDRMARYIHEHSDKAEGPYWTINCAAINRELVESELFGHERGAFTGAIGRKRGLLELAEGGTLLLDEIGELSLPLQAKLLKFLDTRTLTRVGGEKEISINARIMAATNRDLEKEVENGTFRQDLFYRLAIIPIKVPPLRDRLEDIPALLQAIVADLMKEKGLKGSAIVGSRVS